MKPQAPVICFGNIGNGFAHVFKILPEVKEENVVRARWIKRGRFDIYDDTYSASFEATVANLELLAKKKQKTSCVLGDMLELGKDSQSLHENLGFIVAKHGFKNLFTFGKAAIHIAKGAQNFGMKEEHIFINENIDAPEITAMQIKSVCQDDELLFFKASHATHAERIFDFLN